MIRPPVPGPSASAGGRATSVGPDAVHLCLTVRGRPHPYGCAYASYGEARREGPRTAGTQGGRPGLRRGRPIAP